MATKKRTLRSVAAVQTASKIDLDEADLGELAVIANKFHSDVENAGQSMLLAAWNAGQALLTARTLCEPHGWEKWLVDNFDGSRATANRYVRLATHVSCVSDLDATASISAALQAIGAQVTDEDEPDAPRNQRKGSTAKKPPNVETSPCIRFTKRYNTFSDDLNVMLDNAQKDQEFAAAAFNALDHLIQQRNELTAFIKRLRTMFKDQPPELLSGS